MSVPPCLQKRNLRVLIVDNSSAEAQSLADELHGLGYHVEIAETLKRARACLQEARWSVIVLETQLGKEDGMHLLRHRPEDCPPIIVRTADASGRRTIEVMNHGAYDHLLKDDGIDALRQTLWNATQHADEKVTPWALHQEPTVEPIFGVSAPMRELQKKVGLAAASDATVLIGGETGTGKELVARALHMFSHRSSHRFVAVNCGAMPFALLESELFGHEKGAFTGAVAANRGRFQEADGGTLFLDEIGDMPLEMQVKLLRAIQEREIRPLGSSQTISVNVRIVAATHRRLAEHVTQGKFRQDLFFRLNVIPIHVPPLREHRHEIPLLAEYFLKKHAVGGRVKQLTPAALQRLIDHDWPGNVRELENLMENAAAMTRLDHIHPEDLAFAPAENVAETVTPGAWSGLTYNEAMARAERSLLQDALSRADGNRSMAAKRLGLYRQRFYSKLRLYGLL